MQVRAAASAETAEALSQLYGGSVEDFLLVAEALTQRWVAESGGEVIGVAGLRPATLCGAELMGGALPGPDRTRVALALLSAVLKAQPRTLAYGEPEFFPEEALQGAGLVPVSAYRQLAGPLPSGQPAVPAGYTLVPLAEVEDIGVRLAAESAYLDQPGHTVAAAEDVAPDAHGSDDRLGWLAYSAAREPAGIVRGWLEGETLSLGNPGVHAAHRDTGLRQALLLASCRAAEALGATDLQLQSWGETAETWRADEALGLHPEVVTPIYGPPGTAC